MVARAAIVALGAVAWWAGLHYGVLAQEVPAVALFWAILATGMVALFGASWAWELHDVRKGIVVCVTLLVTVLAMVFVIIFAVPAVRGEDVDLDLGKLLGLPGADSGDPKLLDLSSPKLGATLPPGPPPDSVMDRARPAG